MLSRTHGNAAHIKAVGLALAATVVLTGCNPGSAGKDAAVGSDSASGQAVVIRVIDGDTFEASINSEQKTVRLLNVDTPETKDPNEPVQCLGPEATKALEELLPVGSTVRLELDQEPADQYGRTLAGVFDSTGKLVNAEIARLGFGVPVVFEPNRKFHPPVVAAFEEARMRGAGLNSTEIACLPAEQVEQAASAVETLISEPLAEVAADLDISRSGLAAALATVAALKAAATARNHVHWAAYTPARLTAMVARLEAAATGAAAHQGAIDAKKKVLVEAAAAESARQAAEAESARLAAEAESARQAAAAEAAAAAAAEAERLRNLRPAPAPYVPPAYVPPAYVPPATVPNPYPGYTGPRCYAPGGRSWTPCSKK